MSEFHYLRIRLSMEALITEREMMKAMNEHREMQGLAQAYGEEHFANLITQLNSLTEEIRNIGS